RPRVSRVSTIAAAAGQYTAHANPAAEPPTYLGPTPIRAPNDPAYAPGVAPRGIAVTGVDNTNGTWQFSRDGGVTWTNFGSPSNTAALVLESTNKNRIRFVPNANYFGSAGFTFRAWDLTSGLTVTGADGSVVDTSVNGGTTAFSTGTATANIIVNFVNNPPTFTRGPNLPTSGLILEGSGPQAFPNWATNISPG